MQTVANRYLRQTRPLTAEARARHRALERSTPTAGTVKLFFLAVASVALYSLLYLYAGDLITIERRVHDGEKMMFYVPVVIAFVFSLIHGAFTGLFWDALGLKPRKA
jgi:hypothetical protein